MIWIHNCMIIANEYPPIYQHLKIMNRSDRFSFDWGETCTFKSEPYRLLAVGQSLGRSRCAECGPTTPFSSILFDRLLPKINEIYNYSFYRILSFQKSFSFNLKYRLICEAQSIIHSAVFPIPPLTHQFPFLRPSYAGAVDEGSKEGKGFSFKLISMQVKVNTDHISYFF